MKNKIFKVSDIAVIDRYTIENEPIDSLGLMERAAVNWSVFFLNKFRNSDQIVILAGHGNNGGDGYAIARLLKKEGKGVVVYRVERNMSKDCEINYRRYLKAGGSVVELDHPEKWEVSTEAIIVDALFGSGLNRVVEGVYAALIRKVNTLKNIVVAVDIPSGLMGEDNAVNNRENIVQADYTFTFQFPKLSFLLVENEEYVGEWSVLNIGLHPDIMKEIKTPYYYVDKEYVKEKLPQAEKFAHKGTNGHGMLFAGSYGMAGACILGGRASIGSGIGLLTCHVPPELYGIVQVAVPEAMVETDDFNRCFTAGSLGRYGAIAAGPGIGKSEQTRIALKKLLSEWRGKIILDADALNILAEERELLDLLHEGCILTPHPGEFDRLAGRSDNGYERLEKARELAKACCVYIVLKGAHSTIISPEGDCYFNMSGNPGMAKGGMGDALTGVLLSLLANGMDVLDAAICGVYAHGIAGDVAADKSGKRGVSAGKVVEELGCVWRELES